MTRTSKTTQNSGHKNLGPIVFFGNERLATGVTTTAPTLQMLIDEGYDVAAVVSNYERGVSRSARELEVAAIAEKHKIPLLLPDNPQDIRQELIDTGATTAVLVAYGRIVPESVIEIFTTGIVNIHPSLLPLHRGPTPIESVILDGSVKTGVSLMKLAAEMDAGPIYAQTEIELTDSETKQELADRCLEIGSEMLRELLPGIMNDTVAALPQDDSRATYDELLIKDAGVIDWSKPAKQLEREIRAYAEWPKSRTSLNGIEVIITAAHTALSSSESQEAGDIEIIDEDNTLMVVTGTGNLCIEKLKPAGKREMTAAEFLAGYGQRLTNQT